MPSLPDITPTPSRHPYCCVALCLALLNLLDTALPAPPAVTLSVGSGSGLLEALLLHHHAARASSSPASLLGIEVPGPDGAVPANRFLPEQNAVEVPGTWAICDHVGDAQGLLFVYPRQPTLVKGYLVRGIGVESVVWVGPVADALEYREVLEWWGVEDASWKNRHGEHVVAEGETIMIFRPRGCSLS